MTIGILMNYKLEKLVAIFLCLTISWSCENSSNKESGIEENTHGLLRVETNTEVKFKEFKESFNPEIYKLNNNKLSGIELLISSKDIQNLEQQRIEAFKSQFSTTNLDPKFEYVKGKLVYKTDTFTIKIRLKGDRILHIQDGIKWSFKIKSEENLKPFGCKKLNLNIPVSKNYTYELLYHRILEYMGVMAPKSDFVMVYINHQKIGIYLFEEAITNETPLRFQKKESTVVGFDENIFTHDMVFNHVMPRIYSSGTSNSDAKAFEKIYDWKLNNLRTGEAFNIQNFAMFFAINDLLGTHHGSLWKSWRFYFNTKSEKLEPIGFDGHYNDIYSPITMSSRIFDDTLLINKQIQRNYKDGFYFLFNNPESVDVLFLNTYLNSLRQISDSSFVETLIQHFTNYSFTRNKMLDLDGEIYHDVIDKLDSSGLYSFSFDHLRARSKYIQDRLQSTSTLLSIIPGFRTKDKTYFMIWNHSDFPVLLDGVYSKGEIKHQFPQNTLLFPDKNKLFSRNPPVIAIDNNKIISSEVTDLSLKFHLPGFDTHEEAQCLNWQMLNRGKLRDIGIIHRKKNQECLVWNLSERSIYLEEIIAEDQQELHIKELVLPLRSGIKQAPFKIKLPFNIIENKAFITFQMAGDSTQRQAEILNRID